MASADITLKKPLPNSIESERAVLGAILLDDKAIFPATEILTAEDFYLEAHCEIFRAMLALAEEETSIDIFTPREELRHRNKEETSGGPAYLAALTDGLPRAINLEHNARTIREKATSRQLNQLSNETKCRCHEGEERPAEILGRVESQIFKIAARECFLFSYRTYPPSPRWETGRSKPFCDFLGMLPAQGQKTEGACSVPETQAGPHTARPHAGGHRTAETDYGLAQ
jgi:hypothetical protein